MDAAEKLKKYLDKEGLILTPILKWVPRDDGSYSTYVELQVQQKAKPSKQVIDTA